MIVIDSVTTDLTATSSGADTKLTGGTKVVGASAAGHAHHHRRRRDPRRRTAPGRSWPAWSRPLTGSLNDLLAAVGIHLTVAAPVKVAGAGAGELASDGLRIDVELSPKTLPASRPVLQAHPADQQPDPGHARASRTSCSWPRPVTSWPSSWPVASSTWRPGPGSTLGASPTDAAAIDGPGHPRGLRRAQHRRILRDPDAAGVHAGRARPWRRPSRRAHRRSRRPSASGRSCCLALLCLPFIGDRLALAAGAILAADPTDACPLEER